MVFAEAAGVVLWCGERIAHVSAIDSRILTVVVHLRISLAAGSVDSSCRNVASLSPLKVCVGVGLWLCWVVASGMRVSYCKEDHQQYDQDEDQDANAAA